jgi:serpin B
LSSKEINESYCYLLKSLTQADPITDLKISSSIWTRKDKEIQPDFIDLCNSYYNARVQTIDFKADWAADTINDWINLGTSGKIPEIVNTPLDPNIAMILLDAAYFGGDWAFPFDIEYTRSIPFHLNTDSQRECKMMFLRREDHAFQKYNILWPDSSVLYLKHDLYQVVTLPYGRKNYCMTVVVPDSITGIDSVISSITLEDWNSWQEKLHPAEFKLGLPKFRFECSTNLDEILKALGMEIAFDPNKCNFSNMFIDSIGWLGKAEHKTFIQVDEKGTEAAAATKLMFPDAIPPYVLANHPFLFFINEENTGIILFIGKLANPIWNSH